MIISLIYFEEWMSGPVRPLSLIIGPSEAIVLYWVMLPGFLYRLYYR